MNKLLKLLSENSKYTASELALILSEPEDYIKAQIKEYEEKGIIKGYKAVVNWEKLEDKDVSAKRPMMAEPNGLTKSQPAVMATKPAKIPFKTLHQVFPPNFHSFCILS